MVDVEIIGDKLYNNWSYKIRLDVLQILHNISLPYRIFNISLAMCRMISRLSDLANP